MASPFTITMLLADAASADLSGKISMLGAGWSMTGSPTAPAAVVVFVQVPWDRTNTKIKTVLELVDADRHPVILENGPVRAEQMLEVGRPPGTEPGTPIDANFQVSVGAMPLPPGRYEWHLTVAEQQAAAAFTVRGPQQQPS